MNKPRLIDANELFEKLGEAYGIPDDWDGGIDEACEIAFDLVQNAPTAYDTDKVVAELCKKTHRVETYQYGREAVIGLADAIEIVKGGGNENSL